MSGSCLSLRSDDVNSNGGLYTDRGYPQMVVACLVFAALPALKILSATKFELDVNLNAARALSTPIPNTLLVAADGGNRMSC
jgi:hypothetical protein